MPHVMTDRTGMPTLPDLRCYEGGDEDFQRPVLDELSA
jgi:hypothetical protein